MTIAKGATKLLHILLAVIVAFMLPFQVFAQRPSIVTQALPETVVGDYYRVQLFAAGFGKNVVWKAEGLPDNMDIDPADGIIFGVAQKPGVFEVLVTIQSGWRWRPKTDSKRFLLSVSPLPAKEPDAPPVPDAPDVLPAPETPAVPDTQQISPQQTATAEPQGSTESLAAAPALQTQDAPVQWLDLQANGRSMLETTTELYFTFSGKVNIKMGDLGTALVDAEGVTLHSFTETSTSDNEYIYTLSVGNIEASFQNGAIITVIFEDLLGIDPETTSMSVTVHVRASDSERIGLTLAGLVPELLLGNNASMDKITGDLALPPESTEYECDISWTSQQPEIISSAGVVTRPEHGMGNQQVTLTAWVTSGAEEAEQDFIFTVLEKDRDIVPVPPENAVENPTSTPPEILPSVSAPESKASSEKSGSDAVHTNASTTMRTSSNVDKNGALSRASVVSDLQSALQDTAKQLAVVRAQNAQSVSPKTLKALAAAAEAEGRQAVLYADTLTQGRKVDARLYLKPASLTSITEPIKLGIATQGERPEAIKRFFEKHFGNAVSVISCEQQGSFGAKLQIAAKVQLPEDIGQLTFYSYNAETNTFFRILTAYRLDANGYLRFATEAAGDIIVSDGALKNR